MASGHISSRVAVSRAQAGEEASSMVSSATDSTARPLRLMVRQLSRTSTNAQPPQASTQCSATTSEASSQVRHSPLFPPSPSHPIHGSSQNCTARCAGCVQESLTGCGRAIGRLVSSSTVPKMAVLPWAFLRRLAVVH